MEEHMCKHSTCAAQINSNREVGGATGGRGEGIQLEKTQCFN